ncbi:hypothetical protein FHG87_023399 [Trinorchestia longiramus]|nr:hypothetical protein FHG87_023399 [Trinorchestia longiramus]
MLGLGRAWPGPCLAWAVLGLGRAWPGLSLGRAWPGLSLGRAWPGPSLGCRRAVLELDRSTPFLFGQNISNSIYGFGGSAERAGNNVHPIGEMLDDKSFQWFGATLRSNGDVVVFSPVLAGNQITEFVPGALPRLAVGAAASGLVLRFDELYPRRVLLGLMVREHDWFESETA